MTIEIHEEWYYLGMFYAAMETCDVMGCAWREPDGPWQMRYRFRHYRDAKVWNSEDEKNWYGVRCDDASDKSRDKMVDAMQKLVALSSMLGAKLSTYIECNGDGKKMGELLQSGDRPWLYPQKLSKEEAEEYERTGKLKREGLP